MPRRLASGDLWLDESVRADRYATLKGWTAVLPDPARVWIAGFAEGRDVGNTFRCEGDEPPRVVAIEVAAASGDPRPVSGPVLRMFRASEAIDAALARLTTLSLPAGESDALFEE